MRHSKWLLMLDVRTLHRLRATITSTTRDLRQTPITPPNLPSDKQLYRWTIVVLGLFRAAREPSATYNHQSLTILTILRERFHEVAVRRLFRSGNKCLSCYINWFDLSVGGYFQGWSCVNSWPGFSPGPGRAYCCASRLVVPRFARGRLRTSVAADSHPE